MRLDQYLTQHETAVSLAEKIGVTPGFISQWRTGLRPIPDDLCPRIEQSTGGTVSCEELRPDLSWVRIDDSAWPHPDGKPLLDLTRAA